MLNANDSLVRPKKLTREEKCGELVLRNTALFTQMSGPAALGTIVDFFEEPHTVGEFFDTFDGVEPAVLDRLVGKFLLVHSKDERMLRYGIVRPTMPAYFPMLPPAEFLSLTAKPGMSAAYAVLGAPIDVAAGGDGPPSARFGPKAIRSAVPFPWPLDGQVFDLDLRRQTDVSRIQTVDVGDVTYVAGESMQEFGPRLAFVADQLKARGFIPVGLGGDHSVTHFLLAPHIAQGTPFGIIHFDAHTDFFQAEGDILTHANPFDAALASPHLKHMLQIGIRQVLSGVGKPVPDERLSWVSAHEFARTSKEQVFAHLPKDLPYYLTFDIDCMDPSECPETGTRVPGGLRFYPVLECFEYLLQRFQLIGVDFVEVGATTGAYNAAAQIAAQLLVRVLCSHGSVSPLSSQFFRT